MITKNSKASGLVVLLMCRGCNESLHLDGTGKRKTDCEEVYPYIAH